MFGRFWRNRYVILYQRLPYSSWSAARLIETGNSYEQAYFILLKAVINWHILFPVIKLQEYSHQYLWVKYFPIRSTVIKSLLIHYHNLSDGKVTQKSTGNAPNVSLSPAKMSAVLANMCSIIYYKCAQNHGSLNADYNFYLCQ